MLVTVPLPLLLNVLQSVEDNAPLFVADAVGMLSVIVPLDVMGEPETPTSVPLVPVVNPTLVTVPTGILSKLKRPFWSVITILVVPVVTGGVPPVARLAIITSPLNTLACAVVVIVSAEIPINEASDEAVIDITDCLVSLKFAVRPNVAVMGVEKDIKSVELPLSVLLKVVTSN
jgi:hypothetical protein